MLAQIKSRFPAGFKLDPRLSLLGMAALAAVIAVAVVYSLWRDNDSFRPLYGAGEGFPAAEAMQVLDAEALPYHLHPQSGQILVREQDLARARMLLAAKGVKVAVPAGYELFDKEEPLGTSQFVQDVRLKRSLEGELAKTVMALKGIEQARVHLALEESSSFVVSHRAPAKASVMLQLTPGSKLKPEQVAAIVNLVAASVPQLKPEDVSVVDQHGALLSRGVGAWSGPSQNWEVVDDYQQKAVANIEQVLAPILGNDNYRISVAADIDFSQKEETFQAYGEAPRMRSEVLREETTLDQLALGVPGSLSNRPAPTPPADPKATDPKATNTAEALKTENKAATSTRNESTRNNDFDQSVTHIKYPAFALRQQSVAVVLNAANAPEGGWTDKARGDLEAMIKSAVGFNEKRGDSVTLSVFPFTASELAPAEELPWWEKDAVLALIKLGVFGLISLLLLLMVVRPVLRNLTQRTQLPALPEPADADLLAAREGERRLHLTPTQRGEELPGMNILGELNPLSEIRLPAPGSGLEMQVEHLQMLAKNDPERVSEVIKHWIGRNDRDLKPA
ncbi:flagellar basal-body MS-ring/collar protein FliF [Pseudomonas sp. GV071]|uniref:flagellar basal-body MS-ring/collar protein FliF n=1 Tax=Pseudomonas sp. GV071 TaxID=2135754 RepID=UPI000D3673AE|nr:flagellar basal-body MS-ring/collar protein FliF [Pseudomonas sp. GV071]PTQ70090.1 flagellar M-ring protein FliF [Pseudomonas sp. GV071]